MGLHLNWPNGTPRFSVCSVDAPDTDSTPPQEAAEAFRIMAVVTMNGGEALVLNRYPKFLYEFDGLDLLGSDGPFRRALRYAPPSYAYKAFGGSEFDIPMRDGSVVRASGQYWSAGIDGMVSVTLETIESLRKCYVFAGGICADRHAIEALRAKYTGCVYHYRDYEKIITFDSERSKAIDRIVKLERDKRHLIANVKRISGQLKRVTGRAAS